MTVFLITGPPAVGKSTVSRLVAQARSRSVLVDVDRFRDTMVVAGAVLPSPDARRLDFEGLDGNKLTPEKLKIALFSLPGVAPRRQH